MSTEVATKNPFGNAVAETKGTAMSGVDFV